MKNPTILPNCPAFLTNLHSFFNPFNHSKLANLHLSQ